MTTTGFINMEKYKYLDNIDKDKFTLNYIIKSDIDVGVEEIINILESDNPDDYDILTSMTLLTIKNNEDSRSYIFKVVGFDNIKKLYNRETVLKISGVPAFQEFDLKIPSCKNCGMINHSTKKCKYRCKVCYNCNRQNHKVDNCKVNYKCNICKNTNKNHTCEKKRIYTEAYLNKIKSIFGN